LAAGSQRTIDYEDETCQDDLTIDPVGFHLEPTEVTEDDVEQAYEARGTMRERLFAEVAMSTAIECGVFSQEKTHTVFLPTAERANVNKLKTFEAWGQQLKAVCRREADGGGGGLFWDIDGAAVTSRKAEGQVENVEGLRVESINVPSSRRLKRELLNSDQRRAHDIIERQLQNRLAGKYKHNWGIRMKVLTGKQEGIHNSYECLC
jgi:hypothetical protein